MEHLLVAATTGFAQLFLHITIGKSDVGYTIDQSLIRVADLDLYVS